MKLFRGLVPRMANWRDHLTADERTRLVEIKQGRADLKAEHRKIYDRCRKRMAKALEHGEK